jgi:hypothetical protein
MASPGLNAFFSVVVPFVVKARSTVSVAVGVEPVTVKPALGS